MISYVALDLELQPSFTFKGLAVDCVLAVPPRNIPATARKLRDSTSFSASHRGRIITVDGRGYTQPMDPIGGIYRDRSWHGPASHQAGNRLEYFTNIYIPIPFWIFSSAETRTFEIRVRAWVSVAKQFPVELRRTERVNFTNFVRVNKGDDSKKCSLFG